MDMQNVAKLDIPEGEVRTIHDKDGNLIWGKISYGVKYKGDTAQNGTPTPSAPVAVQTVTGEQAISINGAAHTVNLGSIELCKIGNYQDYIYKSGEKWYVRKETASITLDGSDSEGWIVSGNCFRPDGISFADLIADPTTTQAKSNLATSWQNTGGGITSNLPNLCFGWASSGTKKLAVRFDKIKQGYPDAQAKASWLAILADTPMKIIYESLNPTDAEITNQALIAQLEAVEQWLARYGYNATVTGNLPIIIDRTAL